MSPAMERAFATLAGAAVREDGAGILNPFLYAPAKPFEAGGEVSWGAAYGTLSAE